MKILRASLLLLLAACASGLSAAEYVIEDGGVGLTREELEYIVKFWTPDMQQAAAKDAGDRIELLNMALAGKKIAALADTIPPEADPDAYWRQVLTVRSMQRKYVLTNFIKTLEVPDMTALAQERYQTEKDKYALVPEQRISSHILLMCAPGKCVRDERRPEAEKVLAELQAGAKFEELAARYSEDPGSKGKGGKFDQWLTLGQANVEPYYVGAVFDIPKVGDHSGIVETKFGFHIIRLDGVEKAHYLPYEEVKDEIEATLRKEYLELAAKKYDASFRLTDKAYIDKAAVESISAPYEQAADAPDQVPLRPAETPPRAHAGKQPRP